MARYIARRLLLAIPVLIGASFLIFAMGFVARPLGAILFGHLGDRIGRKKTLIWTICSWGWPPGRSACSRTTA